MTMTPQLDMVGIAVANMATALRFYRLLGLDIPEGQDAEPHVEAAGNGCRLAWDTVELLEQIYGEWDQNPTGHRIELAFKCESRDDVDAVWRRMVDHGYRSHRDPWDAFWGQSYAIVEDPDGNLVSLFA